MIAWLITALGLVLVLEGLVYAIFPRQMKTIHTFMPVGAVSGDLNLMST